MAYRLEKEPNGDTAIVIDGWEKGSAPDPYSGINRMYVVNLSVPGEVSVGYPITANTVSGTLGAPIADSTRRFGYTSPGAPEATQSFAILDADGHVFESTSGANAVTGTWTYLSSNATLSGASSSDGLAYWNGWLFKFRNDKVDYWNGSVWVNGWKTITGNCKHFAYVATDDTLYFTNNNFLGSLTAATPSSFDPTSSGTYVFSPTKLELPIYDVALSLAEVGGGNTPQSTLLIGGSLNAIYPWDKTSSSFALPIYVGDSYIKNMVSVNQNAFIFPGNTQGRGRIYITNGSQANLFYKIPDYLFGEQDPYFIWGDAIFHRNNLIFGMFVEKNSNAGLLNSAEIFALDLETKMFRSISEVPGSLKGNATALISAADFTLPGFGFIAGWNDNNSTYGIGYSGTTAGIGGGTVITDLIPIGTFMQKKTFTQVEYKLRSPLEAGESIVVTPLIDGTQGTNLVFSPTVTTGAISGVAPVNFQGNQWLQFSVILTGNSATSGVRLKELRIR